MASQAITNRAASNALRSPYYVRGDSGAVVQPPLPGGPLEHHEHLHFIVRAGQ